MHAEAVRLKIKVGIHGVERPRRRRRNRARCRRRDIW
jgi:hypothetical protein